MARLDDLLAESRGALPQAPDFVILRGLRRAAQKLCVESHVWRESLDSLPTEIGVSTYDYGAPSGARVERVMTLKYNGQVLQQCRIQDLQALNSAVGTPRSFAAMPATQEFQIYPTPVAVATMTLFVVLTPTPDATTLPDDLVRDYGAGIIALAKAALMTDSPAMPWHNLTEASVQAQIGNECIVRAKRSQHGGEHTQLRVKLPRFI
ncbi:MAG: hypothetical protein IPL86_15880 [Flavobacteriales bacterium]|nr:hypothetical protein [Flavobacteriales bacterium]